MSGKVVNLRAARKARARAAARAEADAKAALHGRTKAQRLREADDRARAAAALDGKRREDPRNSD
jgi:hypothetical protein